MTIEQAKLIISQNIEAYKRQSGYTSNVAEAVNTLHQHWFNTRVPMNCKECAISATNRIFKQYLNLYDTPTT